MTVDDPDGRLLTNIRLVALCRSVVEPEDDVVRVNERPESGFVKGSSTGDHGTGVVKLIPKQWRGWKEPVKVQSFEHVVVFCEC